MKLETVVVQWGERERLCLFTYEQARVYVIDSALAARAVASRHLSGLPKRTLFRWAVAEALGETSGVIMSSLVDPVAVCPILRGGREAVEPDNPDALLGRRVVHTAIRFSRKQTESGRWVADVVDHDSENLEGLFSCRSVVVWEGCAASGSTLQAYLMLMKRRNPHLEHATIVCPFLGGLSLVRVAEQAEGLKIGLTFVCFGVYHVAMVGWEGKFETDIHCPPNDMIDGSYYYAVPERQRQAIHALYEPRLQSLKGVPLEDDGFCLVGDVGASMAAAAQTNGGATLAQLTEQLGYVLGTIEAWPNFCQTPVHQRLYADKTTLEAQIAARRATEGGAEGTQITASQ